jgi:hypothetical protein
MSNARSKNHNWSQLTLTRRARGILREVNQRKLTPPTAELSNHSSAHECLGLPNPVWLGRFFLHRVKTTMTQSGHKFAHPNLGNPILGSHRLHVTARRELLQRSPCFSAWLRVNDHVGQASISRETRHLRALQCQVPGLCSLREFVAFGHSALSGCFFWVLVRFRGVGVFWWARVGSRGVFLWFQC